MAANIRAEMGRRNLNQKDVAPLLGPSYKQPHISRRLNGRQDWAFGELMKLSQAWEISITALIAGTDENPFEENGEVEAVTSA